MQPPGGVDTRRETRIICYLAAVSIFIFYFSFFFLLHVLFFVFQNLFPPKGDPGYPCPCGSHRGAHYDGCSS